MTDLPKYPDVTGETIRPLSTFALGVLESLRRHPQPRQEVNPGVSRRLEAESLAETFMAPSPYNTVRGQIAFLRITEAGVKYLEESKS